jgi:hypothetical protein
MTRANNQPSDGIRRSRGRFDFVNDPRQWSAAATEEGCKKLAKAKGKLLVEIIDTETDKLPIICIFEDYPNE